MKKQQQKTRLPMLSEKFFKALEETGKPYHQIAWEAGLSPNRLYKITSGVDRPKRNDPRIVAICEYLGMPVSDAFVQKEN
jgi:hypothetical protein